MQVVHYLPEGHYHCHHDSQDVDPRVPCCGYRDKRNCRLCRYLIETLNNENTDVPKVYVGNRRFRRYVYFAVFHG